MKLTPLSKAFGAEITGVDLSSLGDSLFEDIYAALLDFGVLRFRAQALTKEGLQNFSQRFGPLEEIPLGQLSEGQRAKIENRYVTKISNILVDGKPIGGLGDSEASWHSDMTYLEDPPPVSILLGVKIPPVGGDTFFADQREALAMLPYSLRTRVTDLPKRVEKPTRLRRIDICVPHHKP